MIQLNIVLHQPNNRIIIILQRRLEIPCIENIEKGKSFHISLIILPPHPLAVRNQDNLAGAGVNTLKTINQI